MLFFKETRHLQGAGEGSELDKNNAHPQEEFRDSEMMKDMDPRSRFDILEGKKEWERVERDLKSRLNPNNPQHPEYHTYKDMKSTDCKWQEGETRNDQLISICFIIMKKGMRVEECFET